MNHKFARASTALFNAALLVLALICGSGQAADRVNVVGVASDDSLNMREDIPAVTRVSDAPVIGKIPYDADNVEDLGISVTLNNQVWRKVRFGDAVGWVAARFLGSVTRPDMPGDISCSGTEPFWGLSFEGSTATFKRLGDETDIALSIASAARGRNRVNVWSYDLRGEGARLNALIVRKNQCSDGMSDFAYAFEIYLQGTEGGEGPLQGCCFYTH